VSHDDHDVSLPSGRTATSRRDRLLVRLLRWAPKRAFSSVVGFAARSPLPRPLRARVYRTFARRVGANLDEIDKRLDAYPTLDAFFTRRLRPGVRPISPEPDAIVSPCDGTIAESGIAGGGRLIQAKGIDYRLGSLLPDADAQARFEGGAYVTIYLAPRDYHRVHFPADGTVDGFQHVPGALFPVNKLAAANIGGLFTLNERLVTFQDSPAGEIAIVMVAATGVGHMTVTYDAVETRRPGRGRPGARVRYGSPPAVARGDELGAFHLGSTVILLFEPGRVKLLPMALGQRVHLGEPIARLTAAAASVGAGTEAGAGSSHGG
jgi:phosphatidylserine decarboxylase